MSAADRVYSDEYYEAIAASMGQEAADWARLPRAEREKVLTWYHMNFNTLDDLLGLKPQAVMGRAVWRWC